MKKTLSITGIAFLTSIFTFVFANKYINNQTSIPREVTRNQNGDVHYASYIEPNAATEGNGYTNLEFAAEKSSHAVVHIKTEMKAKNVQFRSPFGDQFFDQFFGGGQQFMQQAPQQASGSGVIVSADGYIVTNNHVVDGADEVTVILDNKKSLQAKVIGKDANTDLAVLKVNETNLPFISFGNSDDVKLGQWVLAVGYPLTLETTVTAGIVSAKYRNIGLNQNKAGNNAIESFIQTDAAVNPGNSGGALVNAAGDLIGINSAIASPTGSYAGYSFAIPSNIVKKVVGDLKEFGNVQRAYLGIGYVDAKTATPEQMSKFGLDKTDGIYVNQVMTDGSADKAGIKVGDIITKIGDRKIKSGPELTELLAQYRPGEMVSVNFIRNGKEFTSNMNLKNNLGNTDIVKKDLASSLGISMREITPAEARQLRIPGGVIISDIKSSGEIAKQTRMKKTFIITQVNDQNIKTVNEFEKIIASGEKEFQLGGIYPNFQGVYYYMLKLE